MGHWYGQPAPYGNMPSAVSIIHMLYKVTGMPQTHQGLSLSVANPEKMILPSQRRGVSSFSSYEALP